MKSFVKFRPKTSRRRQARRFSPWQSALERLEDRVLLTDPQLANPIADQSASVLTSFEFTLPSGTFTDADAADTLTLSVAGLPAWLTFGPGAGKFLGMPSATDAGTTATITVTATDSTAGTASDMFVITVRPNAEPSFTIAADPAAIDEDTTPQPITVANFASNISAGTNESGQTVTFELVSVSNLGLFSAQPAISPNGTLTYAPAADANGTALVTFRLLDNGGTTGGGDATSISRTFKITVNAVSDVVPDSLMTNEDTPITANVITGTNGASVDNFEGTPALTSVTQGTNGLVTFTAAGSVTYTPNADFNGSDSFTYTVTSGGVTETATVTVTINAIADIVADSLTTNEDTAVTANVITGTSGASADNFDGTPVLTSVTQGMNGSVSFTAAGSVTYTPNADFNGSDTFTYTVTSGGVTETATVIVVISAVADIVADSLTTNEDTAVTANVITGTNGASADNFEGTPTLTSVTQGAKGAVTFTSVGNVTYMPNADFNGLDSFTYTVTSGGLTETVTVSVTVTALADIVNDSLSTNEDTSVTANVVTGTNGASADNFEGTPTLISVTQGTNGSVTFTTAGSVTYSPNANFNGSDSFTYTVTSGGVTEVGTVNVTVSTLNDAPSFTIVSNPPAVSEDATLTEVPAFATNINANDAGQAVTNFTVTPVATTGGLTFTVAPTIDLSGKLTYQPAPNSNGTATFNVTLTDNGSGTAPNVNTSASRTFTITVNAVNDAPTISAPAAQTTLEDTALVITGLSFADVDAGSGDVTVALAVGDGTLVFSTNVANGLTSGQILGNGTALVTITAPLSAINTTLSSASGLTYTPDLNFNGLDAIGIAIGDNGNTGGAALSNSTGVGVTVTSVNDSPVVVVTDPTQQVRVDAGPQVVAAMDWLTTLLPGPVDEFGQTLNFTVTTNNDGLFAVKPAILPNGTLTYTPFNGFGGTATITVTVQDNGGTLNGGVDTSTFQFTITTFHPNVKYEAKGSARLRAFVVDGVLVVQINGVPHSSLLPEFAETLTLIGGSRNDEIDLTGLTNARYPNLVSVVIKSGSGNDRLVGSSLNDSIDAGSGNDTLTGGEGDDTLIGNAGTDLLVESAEFVDLALSNAALDSSNGDSDLLVTLENASLTGGDADDVIDASGYTRGSVTLVGGAGNDTLTGGSKNDAISGQDGDDILAGGGGNDTVLGGFGFDMLDGDAGNDLLIGGFDDDIIDGGAGRDTVAGGNGGSVRGGDGVADAGDAIMNSEVISEAFTRLFAFE